MHRSEAEELLFCISCGAEVSASRERAFPVGEDDVLCFECAAARGGVYDERTDRWTEPADVGDVLRSGAGSA